MNEFPTMLEGLLSRAPQLRELAADLKEQLNGEIKLYYKNPVREGAKFVSVTNNSYLVDWFELKDKPQLRITHLINKLEAMGSDPHLEAETQQAATKLKDALIEATYAESGWLCQGWPISSSQEVGGALLKRSHALIRELESDRETNPAHLRFLYGMVACATTLVMMNPSRHNEDIIGFGHPLEEIYKVINQADRNLPGLETVAAQLREVLDLAPLGYKPNKKDRTSELQAATRDLQDELWRVVRGRGSNALCAEDLIDALAAASTHEELERLARIIKEKLQDLPAPVHQAARRLLKLTLKLKQGGEP